MPPALRFLSVLFIFSIAHNVSGEESAPSAIPDIRASPTKEQIAAWIEQLGDEEYFRREDAQIRLRMAGQGVVPSLKAATAATRDMERKARLMHLLTALEREAQLDQALAKLDGDDWPQVEAAVRACIELCLKDTRLWEHFCDAAAKQDTGSVAAAVARWGIKDDNYLMARRDIGLADLTQAKADGMNARADRLRAGRRNLESLFTECLAAFKAAHKRKKGETPKGPPAKP